MSLTTAANTTKVGVYVLWINNLEVLIGTLNVSLNKIKRMHSNGGTFPLSSAFESKTAKKYALAHAHLNALVTESDT